MTEDPFVAHRSLLFTVAYEMLGSAVEAEDVVQESWLRWAGVERTQVRDPRTFLVRIEFDGQPVALSLVVEHGRITRMYVVRNPQKLTRMAVPVKLAR